MNQVINLKQYGISERIIIRNPSPAQLYKFALLYETESGGVFNAAQLAKFSVVVFNNSTGEVINVDGGIHLQRL